MDLTTRHDFSERIVITSVGEEIPNDPLVI